MAVKPSLIARIGREGKGKVAVTHLALLGVKRQETHFGYSSKEKAAYGCFFFCYLVENFILSNDKKLREILLYREIIYEPQETYTNENRCDGAFTCDVVFLFCR